MSAFFGSEGSFPLQFVVIFFVILAILTVAMLVLRRFSGRGLSLASRAGQRNRQPRLGIVDIYELDRQRQLILLRRDNVEHLLLVGGLNDVVIETNIQRGLRMPAEPAPPEPEAEAYPGQPSAEIAASRSEPLFEPSFPMPVVVPSDGRGGRPGAAHETQRASGLPVASAELESEDIEPIPEVLKRDTAAARILRRSTPALVSPRPETASERGKALAVGATGGPQPAQGDRPSPTLPPVIAPSEPRPVDAAVLSDMARQLDNAIARSPSAVTPAPRTAATPTGPGGAARDEAQRLPDRKMALDAVAARMAANAGPAPEPAPPPDRTEPRISPRPDVPTGGTSAGSETVGAVEAASEASKPVNAPAPAGSVPAEADDRSRDPIVAASLAPPASATPAATPTDQATPFSLDAFMPKPSGPKSTPPAPSGASMPSGPAAATPATGVKPPPSEPFVSKSPVESALRMPLPPFPEPPRTEPARPSEAEAAMAAGARAAPSTASGSRPRQDVPLPASARPGGASNPFSVEEIEAEFARLLGRPLDKK